MKIVAARTQRRAGSGLSDGDVPQLRVETVSYARFSDVDAGRIRVR